MCATVISMSQLELPFDQYYAQQFGERWPELKKSLLAPKKYVAIANPWAELKEYIGPPCETFLQTYFLEDGPQEITIHKESQLKQFYPLDYASLYPAHELLLAANSRKDPMRVADLCAAPGGKSLYLLFHLPASAALVVNELSSERYQRLKRVMEDYIPLDRRSAQLTLQKGDAKTWGQREPESFDFVLLDAPCSSERHYLQQPKFMKQWSPSRSKKISQDQFSLLCSALQMLRPGGHLLYSTCALSTLENDGVIERLFHKRARQVELVRKNFPGSEVESTSMGEIILPDRSEFGPIYFSHIIKR